MTRKAVKKDQQAVDVLERSVIVPRLVNAPYRLMFPITVLHFSTYIE